MITAKFVLIQFEIFFRIVRIVKMSATGEVENPAVVMPPVEAPKVEKQAPATGKPVKEKKPRAKKAKSAKTVTHPPYFQMIKEALLALNEKGGSSPHAVAKYMEDKHKDELPANFRKMLGLQLKNSAAKGKLIKIKASYKLSEAGKKGTTTKASTQKVPKADSKRKTRSTRSVSAVVKKTEAAKKAKATQKPKKAGVGAKRARKSTPAKAKQPKSIKSPAAKRAKKVAA
ncbi:Histone H1 [Capsicum baccatum]|uniref:Histone H1 n=1 Tax=Capsicum baccatum TaxID=33114 RepID=A0A2G2XG81_CAPBA|nr:Histone H1 [Capsicum annuum]PHT56513.1 Histone H1 [Capsicum baccatum]